jgi:alpha-beta hydrolase superfamily lysophospholipase
MLHFSTAERRTPSPQSLSVWQKVQVLICGVTVPRPENNRSPEDLGVPGEIVHCVSDDGVHLEGWLISARNPRGTVLLFHGYAASRSAVLEEARALHEMGFTVVLFDFRGSGGSEGNTTTLGYLEAKDVAAAVNHARERGLSRPLVLYGQSMGSAAILRSIAALNVKPDYVILESAFARMLGTVRNRFSLMGVPSFPTAELLVFWGGVQVGFSGFDHNPEEYARTCRCDVLLLHGADDRQALPAEGEAVCNNLQGTKKLVLFEGAGHTSLFGSNPQRWREVVGAFLGVHQQAPPPSEQ